MSKLQFEIIDKIKDDTIQFRYSACVQQYSDSESFFEIYEWCETVLSKNWKVGAWEWQFATEEDRTMFLLRWGG